MSLANADELAEILSERARLGRVFARHAYGMQAWVDLFSPRVAEIREPEVKELVARLVADNARHMLLFRRRAVAHGVDPDAYACPPEGEAIYERIPELRGVDALAGVASWSRRRATRMPADAAVPTFADLQRKLSATSPRAWRYAALRASSRAGALLSDGLRTGYRHGFDSGPFMDHVYADRPSGRTPLGRAIDRRLLRRRTCVAFRDIRLLAEQAVLAALRSHRGP